MRSVLFLPCLLALLGAAGDSRGQAVSFRGKVEDVPGTANQFLVDGTNTHLTSPAIDLNLYLGQQVLIAGTWNGSASAPSVVVQTTAVVPKTFEVGGNGSIGGQMVFGAIGTPGDSAVLAAGFLPTFVPLPGLGVAFFDPSTMVVVGVGPINGLGQFEISVPIPNDPGLLGLNVLGQGAMSGPVTGILVTNPDWKQID